MRAMVLRAPGEPLRLEDLPEPDPAPGQLRVDVSACGVCRTDLHILDGDLTQPKLPLVPGHEIVGRVSKLGEGVTGFRIGQRVGVPWLGHSCGTCRFCRMERENLCDAPEFTGYTRDGGYAEACVADAAYVFPLPEGPSDAELAPLLCAGLIGYRTLRRAGEDAETVGLYGFGAAAHILAQVLVHQNRRFLAFTRPGDRQAQSFARRLGAAWAGGSDEPSPEELDAALIFAPVGPLIPKALRDVRKGGVVVSGGIHMSDIPAFPYADLWQEREIRSVANLTRRDGEEFLNLVVPARIRTEIETHPLEEANTALQRLREGAFSGAAVLTMT